MGKKQSAIKGVDPLKIIDEDPRKILYRPSWRAFTGSVNATIFLQQVRYWWVKSGRRPFYKFSTPSNHPLYKPGDSWEEELGFNRREFENARSKVAVRIKKGDSLSEARKTALVVYWYDGEKTMYDLNEELLREKLVELYGGEALAAASQYEAEKIALEVEIDPTVPSVQSPPSPTVPSVQSPPSSTVPSVQSPPSPTVPSVQSPPSPTVRNVQPIIGTSDTTKTQTTKNREKEEPRANAQGSSHAPQLPISEILSGKIKDILAYAQARDNDPDLLRALVEEERRQTKPRSTLLKEIDRLLNPPAYMDHPAVSVYREKTRITPDDDGRKLIAETVGDEKNALERWEQVIVEWKLSGWNKQNVIGMLSVFENGLEVRNVRQRSNRASTVKRAIPQESEPDYKILIADPDGY